jgi:hypothetical protein
MMRSLSVILAVALGLLPTTVAAQETGGFVILHGTDTVAVERFSREDVTLEGNLVRRSGGAVVDRVRYRARLIDDQSAPLIELSGWLGAEPENGPARQTARVIFKDDSVAVDDATREGGVITRVLPTARGAVPYLNLSAAFLEQATRRAAGTRSDSLAMPFFNLGGGQTVTGTVRRLGGDSAGVRLGAVEFRLRVDAVGRILGGAVPSQGLVITRSQTP